VAAGGWEALEVTAVNATESPLPGNSIIGLDENLDVDLKTAEGPQRISIEDSMNRRTVSGPPLSLLRCVSDVRCKAGLGVVLIGLRIATLRLCYRSGYQLL
jgi:hypothetical protein